MNIAKTIGSMALISATIIAPSATAQETVLQSLVSRMIDSAVELTVHEVQSQAIQSVAVAAHHLQLDSVSENEFESHHHLTNVSVTELSTAQVTASNLTTIEE